jgi:hypothetical protein
MTPPHDPQAVLRQFRATRDFFVGIDGDGGGRFAALIAGPELGRKTEHRRWAAARHDRDKVLMVGDAPGDHQAAEANGVLVDPIDPVRENESWRRFHGEPLPRSCAGTDAGASLADPVTRFEALPHDTPPWKT